MDRRAFLKSGALAGMSLALPRMTFADDVPSPRFQPSPGHGWRDFEMTTSVDVKGSRGSLKVWLPLPSVEDPDWIRPMGNLWQGNFNRARVMTDARSGAAMLLAEWGGGKGAPTLEVVSRVSTRDRAVDTAAIRDVPPLDAAARRLFTAPTELLPTDGQVRKRMAAITKGAASDFEKAKAIYEWVVENTARNPKTRGCGRGDVRSMLETGDLTGKCADLNALYVALARAAGLPARDVYGIRVADSRFGYRSLGKSGEITKAQHCRAEVFLGGRGWVPVDPADVRKVVLEERPGLTLRDEVVSDVRERLFGGWEMNWLAYNTAHDVALPGSAGPSVAFLMYPQGEVDGVRLDCLDADAFRYRITSREVSPAA